MFMIWSWKKSELDSRKTVLIVGGGYAGTRIARQLSAQTSTYDIVLVDARPYHIALPVATRMVVSDVNQVEKHALVPFDRLFVRGNGRFVQGIVKSVDQDAQSVTLESGEQMNYDVLVVATGNSWKGHVDFPFGNVESFINEQRDKFSKAKHIVLIGGGPLGLETAGDIKEIWPEKEVTIVHSSPLPLNTSYPDKFRLAAKESFANSRIKMILGDRVENLPSFEITEPTTITTKNGVSLTADLIITTGGTKPQTTFLSTLTPFPLTPTGFVKVKPTLQLSDHPNIFAAGDVIDWKEHKQATNTRPQAAIVVKNIQVYLDGNGVMREYKGAIDGIVITNGRKGGVGYFNILWGIVLGDFWCRLFRQDRLRLPRLGRGLGY